MTATNVAVGGVVWRGVPVAAVTAVLAGLSLVAGTAAQRDAGKVFQYGNVIYTVPKGWNKGRTNERCVVLISKGRAVAGFIDIFRGMDVPPEPKLEELLRTRMRGWLSDDESKKKLKWVGVVARTGQQDGRGLTAGALQVGSKTHIGVVVKIGGRLEFFRYRGRAPRKGRRQGMRLRRSMQGVLRLVATVRLVSEGAKPLLGAPTPGQLAGAYMGQVNRLGADGSMRFVPDFFVFAEDGRFSDRLPKGVGLAAFDFAKAVVSRPDTGGNYLVGKGALDLRYADGKTDQKPLVLREAGASLRIGGVMYTRLAVPKDGHRFAGVFRRLSTGGFAVGSGIKGGAVSVSGLHLYADGRYTSIRFSGVSASFDGGGGVATSSRRSPVTGRYEVRDGVLVLQSAKDKPARRLSVFTGGPRLLYIDGGQFLAGEK